MSKKSKSKSSCDRKETVCFYSVTPQEIEVDTMSSQFTVSLQAIGTTRNLASGTNIALQYTRKHDQKTAVLIGTTTTDNFGNWIISNPSLIINNPELGNIYLFAEAISADGKCVLAAACCKITVKFQKPPYIPVPGPYPCICSKGCKTVKK
jgi:hypothetical protein